jgi:hypothetical protein
MRVAIVALLLGLSLGCGRKEAEVDQGFDIDSYIEKANNHLATLTQAHQRTWRLGSADRWDADQETGVLTWTFSDGVTVSAPFQIVGTYNSLDGTFLWGWDHPSVVKTLRKDAQAVLDFARKHNVDFLQDRKVACSEDSAWELVALATLVCDRQGSYRGPSGTTLVFMTFGEVSIKRGSQQALPADADKPRR